MLLAEAHTIPQEVELLQEVAGLQAHILVDLRIHKEIHTQEEVVPQVLKEEEAPIQVDPGTLMIMEATLEDLTEVVVPIVVDQEHIIEVTLEILAEALEPIDQVAAEADLLLVGLTGQEVAGPQVTLTGLQDLAEANLQVQAIDLVVAADLQDQAIDLAVVAGLVRPEAVIDLAVEVAEAVDQDQVEVPQEVPEDRAAVEAVEVINDLLNTRDSNSLK